MVDFLEFSHFFWRRIKKNLPPRAWLTRRACHVGTGLPPILEQYQKYGNPQSLREYIERSVAKKNWAHSNPPSKFGAWATVGNAVEEDEGWKASSQAKPGKRPGRLWGWEGSLFSKRLLGQFVFGHLTVEGFAAFTTAIVPPRIPGGIFFYLSKLFPASQAFPFLCARKKNFWVYNSSKSKGSPKDCFAAF